MVKIYGIFEPFLLEPVRKESIIICIQTFSHGRSNIPKYTMYCQKLWFINPKLKTKDSSSGFFSRTKMNPVYSPLIATIPGSFLPSIYSSMAPPPVET
jgi:hypothetical protein